jgi:hypothetical protein
LRPGASELTYEVRHPIHGARGVSRDVRGTLEVIARAPWIALPAGISAPLGAFTSRNRNRDANAMAVLGSRRYPEAAVRILGLRLAQSPSGSWNATGEADGELSLHGVTRPFEAQVSAKLTDAAAIAIDAAFTLSLTAHQVERPMLLLLPIDDRVAIEARLLAARD